MTFRLHMHTLIGEVIPHQQPEVNKTSLMSEIKAKRAILARYLSDIPIIYPPQNQGPIFAETEPTEWWLCLRDTPISLETLSAKQRYRAKKGLKNNEIWIASADDIEEYQDEIYEAYVQSLSNYPKIYKHIGSKKYLIDLFRQITTDEHSGCDIWLCRDIASKKIIGHSICCAVDKLVHLSSVKIDDRYLGNEINAALAYKICEHYINDLGYLYVCDGERNIRHLTNYQDFLIRVVGFKRVYCKLNIVYHPLVKPIINILYPVRKLFKRMSGIHAIFYNMYCILQQEQYARSFLKTSGH